MIIFSVGLIIGGFFGITFMAAFFIGKKEDARRHELHDNFEINQYKQKQPKKADIEKIWRENTHAN